MIPGHEKINIRNLIFSLLEKHRKSDSFPFKLYYLWHRKRIVAIAESMAYEAEKGPYGFIFVQNSRESFPVVASCPNLGSKAIDHIVVDAINTIYLSIISQWELYQKLMSSMMGTTTIAHQETIQA